MEGEDIGDEFKGYIFKITGGQDKQGFSMKQGVLTSDRVRLMMAKGELQHFSCQELQTAAPVCLVLFREPA